MSMISSILLAVDGEFNKQALLAEVSAVAVGAGAKITLLGILDQPPDDPETKVAVSNIHKWATAAQFQDLEALAAEITDKGIPVVVKQSKGKPYEEIIREASKNRYDLIMKPAQREGRKLEFLFGSTDMQLFRMSPSPMWVFKPTSANKLSQIMIAVDLLAFDEEKSALADKVLRLGKHVSDLVGARLHVVHTWDFKWERTLHGQAVSTRTVDSLVLTLKQKHRRWLDEALETNDLKRDEITEHFLKGDAKEILPMITRNQKIDLLVMGTVGRTGIPGFFIGNTADSVLRHVSCSVLAIKPDGFRSPVKID